MTESNVSSQYYPYNNIYSNINRPMRSHNPYDDLTPKNIELLFDMNKNLKDLEAFCLYNTKLKKAINDLIFFNSNFEHESKKININIF